MPEDIELNNLENSFGKDSVESPINKKPDAPKPPAQPTQTIKQYASPPIEWDITQSTIQNLENKLGGKVITYFVDTNIIDDDVKYFYSHLKNIGHQGKLFFILYSYGGDGKASWRIASLLKNFCDELVVVIPEVAASAATMLSLAADQLIMTPLSYLTAVDTSVTHPLNPRSERNLPVSVELDQVTRAVKLLEKKENSDSADVYKTIFNYIHPIALGALERTTNLSEMICQDIMELPQKNQLSEDVKSNIVTRLNTYYPAHSYPIPREKAKELGLNVVFSDKELDDMLWKLISTYRFMVEPVRTDNGNLVHKERTLKIIESLGAMLVVNNILEERLDTIIKGWTTLRNEFRWLRYFIRKTEDGKEQLCYTKLDF